MLWLYIQNVILVQCLAPLHSKSITVNVILRFAAQIYTYHRVIFPELVAFQVMALEHHNRTIKFGHIQTEVISSYLFIGCVRKNLSRWKRLQYISVKPVVKINIITLNKCVLKVRKLTWLPPMPWQLKMPTFSFSFLAMLSRHWLVSTLRICNRTDHTNRLDTVKQLSCMNKHSHVSV